MSGHVLTKLVVVHYETHAICANKTHPICVNKTHNKPLPICVEKTHPIIILYVNRPCT